MTPDANGLLVFAVRRGNIENRLDVNYNAPKYTSLITKLRERFGDELTVIGEVADVICGPFGSAIKNSDYRDEGIPLVRITNISKTGYMDYSDLVYISEELGASLSRTQVTAGDIVISQRGSLGQCAIVDDGFKKLNISANIIAIKNIKGLSAEFIHDYLLSAVGQTLLERSVSGQVQQKITTQDVAGIPIPLHCDEDKLSDLMYNSYVNYTKMLQIAESISSEANTLVLSKLNIVASGHSSSLCTGIRFKELKQNAVFSVEYYHPERLNMIRSLETCLGIEVVKLSDVVSFNRDTVHTNDSDEVYLGLSGVESHTGELSGTYEAVSGQAFIYRAGDILYSRLRPYLNKVYLADKSGICSTEFVVMRVIDRERVLPEYLEAVMRSDLVVAQTKHMMTGNTLPRVSADDVRGLIIPIPGRDIQRQIADEVRRRRDSARRLRQEAETMWQETKEQFERMLFER